MMHKRQLVLEDGTIFVGEAFGSDITKYGEIIFNTGITGYQEVMTDPSYSNQIVTLTYPIAGAYGINRDDFESITPFISGLVVKEISHDPSNFRSEETLDQFLKAHHIPGISGIDTRKLTRIIREKGSMKATITDADIEYDVVKVRLDKRSEPTNLVSETSITKPYIVPGRGKRIVVIDLGLKHSILRELTERDCHITVVPYDYSVESILRFRPDGLLLSNGPGNPQYIPETIETVKSLLGLIPLFGIGLGHHVFALACGAKTEKMHVGQHGTKYPVTELETDQTWLATQSRSYTVVESSLNDANLTVTFRSLNDKTIEGLKHNDYKAFSVQFNPEGSPGPNETNFLFDQFINMIEEEVQKDA